MSSTKTTNMSSFPTFLTLKGWRTKSNGKIRGYVYGHPHHKDGTRINVMPASPISNKNLSKGYLLTTLGNHNYRLEKYNSAKSREEQIERNAKHENFLAKSRKEQIERDAKYEAILSKMTDLTAENAAEHEAFL